jgi:predicted ATP-dependent endonuclease of OLD family
MIENFTLFARVFNELYQPRFLGILKMDLRLTNITIKRFRSLMNVELKIENGQPITICGENNIGKTNVLEATNIFFNHLNEPSLYLPERDIPHHIYYGRGGEAQNTEVIAKFTDSDGFIITTKVTFKKDCTIEYIAKSTNPEQNIPDQKKLVSDVIKQFKYFYVESNNVDIPKLVSELFASDGLVKLDKKRSQQQRPLDTLKKFQEEAQLALKDIEKELNSHLRQLNILPVNDLSPDAIKITFAEFDKLRDVVSRMTQVTIDDGNDHSISSKGSGAQRTALLTLMNYIASNANKQVIWGLDEPEIFLQPKAQKQLFKAIKRITREKNQCVLMTTHSQHFIDIHNLDNTHLFVCDVNEKQYKRVIGKDFFEKVTKPKIFNSSSEKAKDIREHLGIENNDGWNLLPLNILVEGETDKRYLESLTEQLQFAAPNIISAGSATKIAGQIQFFNTLADDLEFHPIVRVVLDNDDEGRKAYQAIAQNIAKKRYSNLKVELFVYPRSDGTIWDTRSTKKSWEVEDFLPPDIVFEGINKILRKAKYLIIKKDFRNKKNELANIDKSILEYAESASSMSNTKKSPFTFRGDGQKMSFCSQITTVLSEQEIKLPPVQTEFLEALCKS